MQLQVKSGALQAHVIQCWRRDALSGVVQRWPWTVSTDAVQLVNCSKSQDRKQRSSCDWWLWLSIARWVCLRRPTACVDVLWDEWPADRAQRDMGVLDPADIYRPALYTCCNLLCSSNYEWESLHCQCISGLWSTLWACDVWLIHFAVVAVVCQYEFARSSEEVRQRHRASHQGRPLIYTAVVLGVEADETVQRSARGH